MEYKIVTNKDTKLYVPNYVLHTYNEDLIKKIHDYIIQNNKPFTYWTTDYNCYRIDMISLESYEDGYRLNYTISYSDTILRLIKANIIKLVTDVLIHGAALAKGYDSDYDGKTIRFSVIGEDIKTPDKDWWKIKIEKPYEYEEGYCARIIITPKIPKNEIKLKQDTDTNITAQIEEYIAYDINDLTGDYYNVRFIDQSDYIHASTETYRKQKLQSYEEDLSILENYLEDMITTKTKTNLLRTINKKTANTWGFDVMDRAIYGTTRYYIVRVFSGRWDKFWSRYTGRVQYYIESNDESARAFFVKREKNTFTQISRDEYDTVVQLYAITNKLRQDLFDEVVNGNILDSVNIDDALDLGNFKLLKKFLVKSKDPIYDIVFKGFPDIVEPTELKTKILNLLKVYDAFTNFPEKNILILARFISNNKLSEYYDRLREEAEKNDDVAKEVLNTTQDMSLAKKILSKSSPKVKHDIDMTKSFTISAKLDKYKTDKAIINDTVRIVENLNDTDLLNEFNVSSDVALINYIELNDAGDTLIFNIYTIDENKDFDMRRLNYLTKLYNMKNTSKIYFEGIND